MTVREIALEEFESVFPSAPAVYASAAFNILNRDKADRIAAFAACDGDGRPVLGQIMGLRDGRWLAPFSAPFSAPSAHGPVSVEALDEFYGAVRAHTHSPLRIVCPPPFYSDTAHPTIGRIVEDANFHYEMARFADYEKYLSRSGRYSHHRGRKTDFEFTKTDDIPRAYAVIEANRRAMGYPLAMSLDLVTRTVGGTVDADFFVLSHIGQDVGAAMLYSVTPGIMQVIYWGDLPHIRPARGMNYMAWRIFGWYADHRPDIRIIDIGPSSSDGVRNEGLCQFKLSLGCIETPKPTIYID